MILARINSIYNLVTGIWPIADIKSFERITGPKYDKWLVKTVGVVVASIGLAQLVSAKKADRDRTLQVVSAASTFGLAVIDIYYVSRRRIRPVYLVDAAVEIGLGAAWTKKLWQNRK